VQSVLNEEEDKNEEIETKFCSLISWDWLARFALACGVTYLWGISEVHLVKFD